MFRLHCFNQDDSSLDLLAALATANESSSHTFLIGSYRSNEVDENHILSKKLAVIKEFRGISNKIIDIPLGNLSEAEVNSFVSTSLRCSEGKTATLARVIRKKTGGNPFFTAQFLLALQQEGILEFQLGTLQWTWDLEAIETKFVANNIADLMQKKLTALPRDLQMILQVCSCLGCDFDIRTLRLAARGFPDNAFERSLEEYCEDAVRAGIIVYSEETAVFSFVHDQLQSASFNLIEKEDADEFQGKIGRAIIANASADDLDSLLLVAIDLCNCDANAISKTPEDKIKFASRNLQAGKQAMKNSAFVSAASYLQSGITLIEYGISFDDTRDLQIELYSLCGKAYFSR